MASALLLSIDKKLRIKILIPGDVCINAYKAATNINEWNSAFILPLKPINNNHLICLKINFIKLLLQFQRPLMSIYYCKIIHSDTFKKVTFKLRTL